MIQLLLAVVLVVHGTLHLVGVAAPWRLAAIGHLEVTEGFFGHIRISDDEARALGVVWVLVAIAFIGAGIGVLFGADFAFGLTLVATLVSMAICLIGIPETFVGLVLDGLILFALAWISLVGTVPALP